jgi:hypothetical protein
MSNYESGSSNAMLNDAIQFVENDLQSIIDGDTDLQNIRDEMLSLFNQTKYLLTLN